MASLPPPVMRPNLNLPIGPIEKAIAMLKTGWPVYACSLILMYAVGLAIEALVFGITIASGLLKGQPRELFTNPVVITSFVLFFFIFSAGIGVYFTAIQLKALEQIRTGAAPTFKLPSFNGRLLQVAGWYAIFYFCFLLIYLPAFAMFFATMPIKNQGPFPEVSPIFSLVSLPLGVINIVLQVGFLLTPLLMVEKGLGMKEAALESWNSLKPNLFMWIIAMFLNQIFAGIGALACGVGFFYTAGVIFTFPAVMYVLTVQDRPTGAMQSQFQEGR